MDAPDGISRLLEHLGLRAQTFHAGPLCGLHDFPADEGVGHLHVIRGGRLAATQAGHGKIAVREPTLLFYPRPVDHRLDAPARATTDVLCARVRYGAGLDNAITQSLPPVVVIPFSAEPRIEPTLDLLFAQAAEPRVGRQVLLDRLCDVLLIQVVRLAIERGWVAQGVLAGLSDRRLGPVLVAMLDAPAQPWTLDTLASRAHLSRNAFARQFRTVVGTGAGEFLARVRIAFAQRLLARGRPVALVATAVGYGSQPAFSRAFIRELGVSPSAWLRREAAAGGSAWAAG